MNQRPDIERIKAQLATGLLRLLADSEPADAQGGRVPICWVSTSPGLKAAICDKFRLMIWSHC